METFSALLAICAGNSPVTGEFPTQKPVTRSFDVFFAWINGWVNNREAGDLRRHRAQYDVIVLLPQGNNSVRPVLTTRNSEHYKLKHAVFVSLFSFLFLYFKFL